MCGGDKHNRPALAMDIVLSEDGTELISAIPTDWEHWVQLPVREGDPVLMTRHGPIRAPVILINPKFSKMPKKLPRLTKQAIFHRDGYTCGYTGKKLSKGEATIDHIIPRSLGGKDDWENLITCEKKTNFAKGNKTNKEAGLSLLKKPLAPMPLPVSATINQSNHPHWSWFIGK